jgi:glycine/D-amino acid oxidase-like deaminating enzyme
MRVVVAGGGIFGQVVAWRLAARGHAAVVVEPRGPGNAASASGDRSRIVRALYDEPCFAASGHRSLDLWARWSAELGARIVEPIGVAYLDRAGEGEGAIAFRAWIDKGVANLRALGASVEEIAPADAARRWPGMSPEGLRRVVFEPAGGFGRPALAARAVARAGLATGLVTHVAAAADRVLVEGGAARGLATVDPAGEIAADAVVVAAGLAGVPLVAPFAGDLGIRSLPHWTSYWDVPYPEGAGLAMGRLPAWADLGALIYGFPDDGESGFKMAWHAPRSDPGEHAEGPPTAEQLEALRRAAEARFPALRRATCRGTFPCAYDATPDERFRIGPVPGVAGLYFVGGMSGHGFKHAPAIGDAVAALVAGEVPETSLAPYALV